MTRYSSYSLKYITMQNIHIYKRIEINKYDNQTIGYQIWLQSNQSKIIIINLIIGVDQIANTERFVF